MSPDVVLECQECGRGSADSCMTMGKPLYHYYFRYYFSVTLRNQKTAFRIFKDFPFLFRNIIFHKNYSTF